MRKESWPQEDAIVAKLTGNPAPSRCRAMRREWAGENLQSVSKQTTRKFTGLAIRSSVAPARPKGSK